MSKRAGIAARYWKSSGPQFLPACGDVSARLSVRVLETASASPQYLGRLFSILPIVLRPAGIAYLEWP